MQMRLTTVLGTTLQSKQTPELPITQNSALAAIVQAHTAQQEQAQGG